MGNITRICHAMDKIPWSLWICVTGANCDTSERNHQNISLVLQFGGKTVRNHDGLKRFSILALEFLYFNCLVPCGDTPGSHPHSTGSRETRICGARGGSLQLEAVGAVFVEVFPVCAWTGISPAASKPPFSLPTCEGAASRAGAQALTSVGACAEQSRGMSMARGAGGDVSARTAQTCSALEQGFGIREKFGQWKQMTLQSRIPL